MALVQSSSFTFALATSTSRTYGSATTSGNLLISCISSFNLLGTITYPTGWTPITDLVTGNMGAAWAYKFADGTETSVAWSWTTSGSGSIIIAEYDDVCAVLDASGEDESNASSVVTSQSSGSATATQTTGAAIAFFAFDRADNCDGSPTYSNSFAESVVQMLAGVGRAGAVLAYKAISGTGSYTTTRGCTDTGDESYGAIALFTPATSGGVGPIIGGRLLTGLVNGGRLVA